MTATMEGNPFHFSTKSPIVQLHLPMSIQVAGVARGEQNTIKDDWRIHLPLVPVEDLQRGMATVLAAFVSVVALMVKVVHPLTMNTQRLAPTRRPRVQMERGVWLGAMFCVVHTTLIACGSLERAASPCRKLGASSEAITRWTL